MAFLKKERDLPSMMLCGNPLPWVDKLVHLGCIVSNNIDGGQVDMKQKVARYIDKNCSINQEFSFAHPTSKILLNQIYNCHFSGCQVWNLFSSGAKSFYSTYNRSVKLLADLPYATHRFLIEPLSGLQHMSIRVIRNFISSIRNSPIPVLRQLYNIVKSDVRTTTGANLRNVLLKTGLSNVDEIDMITVKQIKYKEIKNEDMWRIPIIMEALDIKYGLVNPPEGWSDEELNDVLHHACTA